MSILIGFICFVTRIYTTLLHIWRRSFLFVSAHRVKCPLTIYRVIEAIRIIHFHMVGADGMHVTTAYYFDLASCYNLSSPLHHHCTTQLHNQTITATLH